MTAHDARNDVVQFLYKHGDLTYSAAAAAISRLCNNGFHITRADLARAPLAEAHPLAAEARTALARDDVAGWIGSLPKAPLAEALAVIIREADSGNHILNAELTSGAVAQLRAALRGIGEGGA